VRRGKRASRGLAAAGLGLSSTIAAPLQNIRVEAINAANAARDFGSDATGNQAGRHISEWLHLSVCGRPLGHAQHHGGELDICAGLAEGKVIDLEILEHSFRIPLGHGKDHQPQPQQAPASYADSNRKSQAAWNRPVKIVLGNFRVFPSAALLARPTLRFLVETGT
jgi:hypothetical protein